MAWRLVRGRTLRFPGLPIGSWTSGGVATAASELLAGQVSVLLLAAPYRIERSKIMLIVPIKNGTAG